MLETVRCTRGTDNGKYTTLLRVYERIFIALVGNENNEVRDDAIRALNGIYDGNDWQFETPYTPVLK